MCITEYHVQFYIADPLEYTFESESQTISLKVQVQYKWI